MKSTIIITTFALLAWTPITMADWTEARCDIYPRGEDRASAMIPCTFSQRQGYITISRDDGVVHELSPVGDLPGNFTDQDDSAVYRQSGLGDQGQIFRFSKQSVYVYWDTSAFEPQSEEENWTAPFTTREYDATTRLRCRAADSHEFGSCPAGILRMDGGQASIEVQNSLGERFTINFMKDHVNASNREAEARLEGDTWIVTINGEEVWEVPLAAIEGG